MLVEDHLPYMWAAYRKGAFKGLHPVFDIDLSQLEFRETLGGYLESQVLSAVVFFAGEELKAVGVGFFWIRGRVVQTSDLIWFPWASSRNVVETYVNFINELRSTIHADTGHKYMLLEFCQEKDKGFFDHICKYGIMRRIGSSFVIHPDQLTCVYETRE